MAKGKHSAALFEVIKGAKHSEGSEQSLRTPKWWFKGSQTPSAASRAAPSFNEPAPVAAAPSPLPAPQPTVARSTASRSVSGRSSGVHFAFDGDRKEITLRLRYTTALVSAFGVCMLIALSYVVGRHLGHGPQVASASEQPEARQITQQPVQRNVTDISRAHNGGALPPDQSRRHVPESTNIVRPPQSPSLSLIPPGVETRMPRTIGLNYVIVQTYPPDETKAAETARDFLNHNGIPCTLEHTSWAPNKGWVCLVGTAGFSHISTPEYRTYVNNITTLGDQLKTSRFDRFKPQAIKWPG